MRHDELYVADLIDSTRAVREYLDGISREHWDEDRVLRDAVLYRLLLLGEIASVDWAVVWQISREEVPVLEEQAMDIMRAEFPELAKTYEPETVVEPDPDDKAEPGQGQTA
jgi:uncharacterized protein with HEPN domain